MKKFVSILLLIIIIASLTGCSSGCSSSNSESESIDGTNVNTTNSFVPSGDNVDLTALSSTMVYSEVYNMMRLPDRYIGKNIKMKGTYSQYHDDVTNKDYDACIIADATACCSQGIEFELTDKNTTINSGDIICVSGTFDTYDEGDYKYFILRNATLEY